MGPNLRKGAESRRLFAEGPLGAEGQALAPHFPTSFVERRRRVFFQEVATAVSLAASEVLQPGTYLKVSCSDFSFKGWKNTSPRFSPWEKERGTHLSLSKGLWFSYIFSSSKHMKLTYVFAISLINSSVFIRASTSKSMKCVC